MALRWRIFYGDGTTYSDQDGSPEHAPPIDVACIVVADREHGRRVLWRWDFYFWVDGSETLVSGGDVHGLIDRLMHDRDRLIYAVKQGRMLGDVAFEKIMIAAMQDPDFPPKTGTRSTERGGAFD